MKFHRDLNLQTILIIMIFTVPTGSVIVFALPPQDSQSDLTVDLADGLIDRWSFDEESGTSIIDTSNDANLGTLFGATRTAGPMGQALEFDGIDDFVEISDEGSAPSHLSSVGDGTISIWFKLNELPDDNGISPLFYYGGLDACSDSTDAANQGFVVEVGHGRPGSHRIYFTSFGDGCEYPSFCVDSRYRLLENQWYQFTAVVDSNYNTLYLNGEELTDRHYNFGSEKSSEFFETAVVDETIWLGKGYWNNQEQYLNGSLDDIRVYDRPLNANEVSKMYNLADLEYRSYETLYDTSSYNEPEDVEFLQPASNSNFIEINNLFLIFGLMTILTTIKLFKIKKKAL